MPEKVAIVGSGLVGRSWAMLFAGVGYQVALFDVIPEQVALAKKEIENKLTTFEAAGLLRKTNKGLTAKEQIALIEESDNLAACIKGAKYIQESVPENPDLKQKVLSQIDQHMDEKVILASSTSAILPSVLSENLKHREQFIVAHPVNPPYFVPLVELVPAPWTRQEVVEKTRAIQVEIGQSPVVMKKELKGFILNRLQYALMNECWRLVESGYASVEDVDTTMSEGLGMRYAFLGPLETAHLNAEGMMNYIERYGETIYGISCDFGPIPKFGGNAAVEVDKQLTRKVPVEELQQRREWRDKCIAQLSILKNSMKDKK